MKQHLLALFFHAALLAGCSSSIDLANYDMEDPSIAEIISESAPEESPDLRMPSPLRLPSREMSIAIRSDRQVTGGCSSYAPLRAVNPLKAVDSLKADVLISVPRILDSR